MPKSKSKRRRYQPPPKPKPKASPRWVGPLILALLLVGAIIIVLNYLGLIPGTGGRSTNAFLWVGLGLIGVGFGVATQWR